MSEQEGGRVIRKRRKTRTKYQRFMPKPSVVIDGTSSESSGGSGGHGGSRGGYVPGGGASRELNFKNLAPSTERSRDVYSATDKDNDIFCDIVEEVLNAAGVEWEAEFEHGAYQRAEISIEGEEGGALIGRRGAGIEALELLLSRMASQSCGHSVPVQIDVNEYRAKQEGDLKKLALDAAKRFLDSNEPQHLPIMGPRDRRVVHVTIKAMESGPATYTVGDGRERHIVVGPHND